MRDGGEAELRGRYSLRAELFEHGRWRVEVLLPRAAEELIDEAEFEDDERLPYWADLWPSARALARHLLDHPPAAARALELRCGVALPALALCRLGVAATATDWYADALRFARVNAARNGLAPLETAVLDWRYPPRMRRFPLVVAADVLYEARNAEALAALLPEVVAPGGSVLVADPGRVYAADFLGRMRRAGWRAREVEARTEPSARGAESRVRILRLDAG